MVDLLSPLSPEECARLLRGSINSPWSSVTGWERPRFFQLRLRSPNIRNSFRTFATVTLIADGPQTRIHCRFGMHPFVRAVLGLWFCIIVAGLIFELAVAFRGANFDAAPPMVLLLMLLFGFGLVRFGRWVARDEQGLLLDFVKATLKARDAADLPPP